jgi:DNA-3-methyladenine glycosylase II
MSTVGPCTLKHNPDGFFLLARAIVSQQISTKAAVAIAERLAKATGRHGITPKGIMRLDDDQMRGAGLSASKVKSLRDLADKVHSGTVPLGSLTELDDEQVIESLIPVRGIGRWTAEMFLIFSLGRLDVLPVDDFGLRNGIRKHYGLEELPVKKQIVELAEPWRPYRSIATWYIWQSLAKVPAAK